MKDNLLRNAILSVLILLLPVLLAVISRKYVILAGLGVFFVCTWICSILANTKVKEDPKKDHADILIRVIGIFGNLVYAAAVIYGIVALIIR